MDPGLVQTNKLRYNTQEGDAEIRQLDDLSHKVSLLRFWLEYQQNVRNDGFIQSMSMLKKKKKKSPELGPPLQMITQVNFIIT